MIVLHKNMIQDTEKIQLRWFEQIMRRNIISTKKFLIGYQLQKESEENQGQHESILVNVGGKGYGGR